MATQENKSMVSEVSIANQALSFLGQKPIRSFNDPGDSAEWMKNNYPFLRDAVIEARMWTFATVRAVSTTADMDEWGEAYRHNVPLEWLSVRRCYRTPPTYGNTGAIDKTWKREGQYVLSRYATIYMWGQQRITDTAKFTTLFVQALAARLAADASIGFTENRNLQADAWNLYAVKLAEAAANDGLQGSNEVVQSNALLDARVGYGYR